MENKKPLVIVISGPSGAGKGTIIKEITKKNPHLKVAISATTRTPRHYEMDGKDYYFLSEEEFNKKIDQQEFLEWALVHRHKYGTLRSEVESYINNGYDIILEIDIQGAHKIKNYDGKVISIFITPPSFQDLIERLHDRNSDEPEMISQRLETARKEMKAIGQYDYIVVNEEVNNAVKDVIEIINLAKQETAEKI